MLFEPGGSLTYCNAAAQRILGARFGSTDSVSPDPLRQVIQEVRGSAVDTGQTEPAMRQFEADDRIVEATVLAATPPGTVVVVLRDVTRARGLDRLRRDFVANASHELKTPVASILALSGVLRIAADSDPAALARFLPLLEGEAERLAALVGDLLELSQLEGRPPERGDVELLGLVTAVAERLRWRAEAGGLGLRVEGSSPAVVWGSETDLGHLIQNLLENAVRYTPEGGEVTVAMITRAGHAELSVSDTGIGIPARDLGRIFERFYRVDADRSRRTGGTGLGLSIVRNIAEAHGGVVHVTSAVGVGSTFTLRLPIILSDQADLAGASQRGAAPGADDR